MTDVPMNDDEWASVSTDEQRRIVEAAVGTMDRCSSCNDPASADTMDDGGRCESCCLSRFQIATRISGLAQQIVNVTGRLTWSDDVHATPFTLEELLEIELAFTMFIHTIESMAAALASAEEAPTEPIWPEEVA